MDSILSKWRQTTQATSDFDLGEYERRKAERYNVSRGALNLDDGIDCPKCLNRGHSMVVYQREGVWQETFVPCECMQARSNVKKLQRSGLKNVERMTLDKYIAPEDWQKKAKLAAQNYVKSPRGAWMFAGGAVGAGKTHLCTGAALELIAQGELRYVIWPDESDRLKAERFDPAEESMTRMRKLQTVDILYIDDFFKITGNTLPTEADIRLAHELLNRRYMAGLRTIISSERYLDEITQIDSAIGGRIAEKAAGYIVNIKRDRERDYRFKIAKGVI